MKLKHILAIVAMKLFQLFPVNKKKIFFSSYQGSNYNNYPRMISERLHDSGGYILVWALNKKVDAPAYIKRVKPESLRELFALATSGVWVDNCRKNFWIRKKKKQIYIQTWHGPVCIKAVEADARLNDYYIQRAKNDSKMADYILSQCEWRTRNIQNAFWYGGEIIKGDTNRFDAAQKEEAKKSVYDFYGLAEDVKIILYAPTFRKNDDMSPYDMDFQTIRKEISEKFGGQWVFLFRLHPNISRKFTFEEGIVDGGLYQSMERLTAACDILITDYSGCMFDGFKLEKTVFLYASDYQKYVAEERTLYFDLHDFPAPLAVTNEQLVQNIRHFSMQDYLKKAQDFNRRLGYYEQDGIEEIVNIIRKGR